MTDYKPGLYAVTSWRGERQMAFRTERGEDMRWCVLDGGDTRGLSDDEVREARPLVVLDLDPAYGCWTQKGNPGRIVESLRGTNLVAAHAIADQIEAQTKQPKPTEPKGLGAVVQDANGIRWVRVTNNGAGDCWKPNNSRDKRKTYGEVDAVRVLSEGVDA